MLKIYLKKMLMVVAMLLCCVAASAWDFVVDGIFYNVTKNLKVEVTYRGTYSSEYSNEYSGNVVIPSGVSYNGKNYSVTSIGNYAFDGCTSLAGVAIPNSVTSIGDGAFSDCSSLANITIPNSVTNIGYSAFYGCSGLTSATISNGVTSIGGNAFLGCSGLTSVTIPNSVINIGGFAFFGCSGLTSITIPNSVTSIGSSAFAGCSGLTSIVVEKGNSVYDSRDNCNAIIETATNTLIQGFNNTIIPNSVTSIGNDAFRGWGGLTSIKIPNSVTNIGVYAFYNCLNLTSVTIGSGVTSIESDAFIYCSGLTSIYLLGETPAKIYSSTFDNFNATLYVPQGSLEAYKTADVWKKIANIVEFDVTAIEDVDADTPAFKITAGGIQLTAAEGKAVAVYSVGGELVEKFDSYANEEIVLDKSVYILRVGGKAVKVKL